MWVRCQKRDFLVNVQQGFYLSASRLSIHACGIQGVLATYSSEEKALAALDLIEKHISGMDKKYIVPDRGNTGAYEVYDCMYTPYGRVVFQMPQDDEV